MTGEPDAVKGDRILVVDDDEFVCNSLKWLLLDEGYTVEVAVDGRRALDVIENARFDLVLTDLMMPDVDGLDVLRAVKHSDPNTAVIILTGYGTLEAAMAALKDGAYDFLTKPCDDGEMKYKIEGALEQKRLKERLDRLENAADRIATAGDLVKQFSDALDRELERMVGLSSEEMRVGLAGLKRKFEALKSALGPIVEEDAADAEA